MHYSYSLVNGVLVQNGYPLRQNTNVSAIDFNAGRGSTGVDLRWHPTRDFKKLPSDQKDELISWMKTQEGKKLMSESRKSFQSGLKRKESDKSNSNGPKSAGNWKRRLKKAIKTPNGLKAVMSVLADEEKSNQALVAALQSTINPLPPAPPAAPVEQPPATCFSALALPATTLKLQSILKNKSSSS